MNGGDGGTRIVFGTASHDRHVNVFGFEFLHELRQRPTLADIPVIVVTAKELSAEDVRFLSGQTDRVIPKDQTYLTELVTAVRERLARRPAREAEPVVS